MSERPSFAFRVAVGVLTALLTALIDWITNTFPFPFYPGLFVVGPFAVLWFLAPALLVPKLMAVFPLERRSLPRLLVLTAAAFAASATYLMNVNSHPGNTAGDLGVAASWFTAAILALVAGAGYLRESRALSAIYHVLLGSWFFALAFPYTGEFL